MGEQKNSNGFVIFLIILIIALLVWGYIGGKQAQKTGITCDFGIGEKFCWRWHTNAFGQVQEFIKDTTTSVKDSMSGN
jgi:hypothetical protein